MKLTWHIVVKDLRRLLVPLAVWTAIFLSEILVGARLLYGNPTSASAFKEFQSLAAVLYGLRISIGFLLVPALVFEDGLVDTSAFWPTRPISGLRLLGAKLLGCLLIFGLLPILVPLPWWLLCGYGGHQVLDASLDSLGFQVLPVSVGLMIAALTGSFPRFLGWTCITVAAAVLTFITMVQPAGVHLFLHGADIVAGSEVNVARLQMIRWVSIAACLAVAAHQYLTRRLALSFALVTCIVGFLVVEVVWWPVDLNGLTEVPSGPGATAPLDSRIEIQPAETSKLHIEGDSTDTSDAYVFGTLSIMNVPVDMTVRFDRPVFEWRWPDGSTMRRQGVLLGRMEPAFLVMQRLAPHKAPSESAWERSARYRLMLKDGKQQSIVDYEKSEEERSRQESWDFYVKVPRPEGLRMLSEPPSCTLELQGDIARPKVEAEIPLARGESWTGNGEAFRIARNEWSDRTNLQNVVIVGHRAAIGEPAVGPFSDYDPYDWARWFVAINRSRGESAWPVSGNFAASARIATVAIAWRALSYVGPVAYEIGYDNTDWKDGRWVGTPCKDWFSDASLGRLGEAVDGRFSRRVPIEKFTVTLDGPARIP